MKWVKRILGIGILAFCVIGTIRFIKIESPMKSGKQSESAMVTTQEQEESKTQDLEKNDVWSKIASTYMEGAVCEEASAKVKHRNWIYQIHSAKITKNRNPKWDFVPKFEMYQYDKYENLINDYSYVAVDLTIQCEKDEALEHYQDLYLNSIGLGIFDENGMQVSAGEMRTAILGKKEQKNYFFYNLKDGEQLNTEVVFIIEDKFLTENNYYVIDITNGGIKQSLEDFVLMKLPMGVEKNETGSKK